MPAAAAAGAEGRASLGTLALHSNSACLFYGCCSCSMLACKLPYMSHALRCAGAGSSGQADGQQPKGRQQQQQQQPGPATAGARGQGKGPLLVGGAGGGPVKRAANAGGGGLGVIAGAHGAASGPQLGTRRPDPNPGTPEGEGGDDVQQQQERRKRGKPLSRLQRLAAEVAERKAAEQRAREEVSGKMDSLHAALGLLVALACCLPAAEQRG